MKSRSDNRRTSTTAQKRRSFFQPPAETRIPSSSRNRKLRFETLEERRVLAVFASSEVDVPLGVFSPAEIAAMEVSIPNPNYSTRTPPQVASDGIHEANILTVVLDFKDAPQGNTTDAIGNTVGAFDVTAFGFTNAQLAAVENAVLTTIDSDYFGIPAGSTAIPLGTDLRIDFVIGDIGTPPVGLTNYYYVQIGTFVSGPGAGAFGQAGLSLIRNSAGAGPNFGTNVGDVVGSIFTDSIVAMGSLTPANALTSGNLTFTANAIGGTTAHEIGHALSLSHVNKAGVTTPNGRPPLMGTGAIDLPNQDRLAAREFDIAGFDAENGGAAVAHIAQLVTAVGTHSIGDTFASLAAGVLTITDIGGGTSADSLTFSRSGTNLILNDPLNILASDVPGATGQGTHTLTIPLAGITSIAVNTLGGADLVTVDFNGGNFIPAGGFTFDGGAGAPSDKLVLKNGTALTEVSTATGPGSGTIVFGGGTIGTANITYAGLEPVDDTVVAATYTFNATAGNDVINIVNGPVTNGFQATQINSGNALFELQNIANKGTITVNALAGDDVININNPAPGVGLTTLTVDTGISTVVRDTVNVQTTPAGVVTNVTDTVFDNDDNVNIGNAGSINGILGVVNVSNPPNFTDLVIDDSADAVGRTITFSSATVTFSGQAAINYTVDTHLVTIQAGSGSDVFTIPSTQDVGGAVVSNLNINTLNGNGGNDTFNFTGGGAGTFSINNLNGGTGDDIFNITAPIRTSAIINVDGGPHITGDALNVDAGGSNVVVNGNGQIVISGTLNYVNIETVLLTNLNSLTVNGDAANNNLGLTRTQANRFSSLLDAGPAILFDRPLAAAPATQYTFNGLAGDDTLTVGNAGAGGLVNLRTTFAGGLNNAPGAEASGPPGDTLVITGNPGAPVARETYLVGATQDAGTWVLDPDGSAGPAAQPALRNGDELVVVFTGLEPVDTDTPATIFDVILPGGAGTNDNLTVDNVSSPLNGFAAVRVLDNAGTFETFRFARKDTTRIMGNLNNAGGIDTFRLDYATAPQTASGAAFTLETYGHLSPDVQAIAGQPADDSGTDRWALIATPAGTTNSLFGQLGSDRFNNFGGVTPLGTNDLTNVAGTVNITGGTSAADNDELLLSDLNAAAADTNVVVTNTQITGLATATVNYSQIETTQLAATQLADTFNILSTAANNAYLIRGNGNADRFTVGNSTANFNANTFTGTLAGIQGSLLFIPDGAGTGPSPSDTLNIDASGDANLPGSALPATITNVGAVNFPVGGFTQTGNATQLANFSVATAPISYFHAATSGFTGDLNNNLEILNIRTSLGNDVINVNDTTATVSTTLDAREGNDTITIAGDNLSAANLFRGLGTPSIADGNDTFILNITNNLGALALTPLTSLQLEGNNQNAGVDGRDRVLINDNNGGFVRSLNYHYLTAGSGDIDIEAVGGAGLAGAVNPTLALRIRTMESVTFIGTGANNDNVTVTGITNNDDILSIIPGTQASGTALVYRGGSPYLGTPPATLANARPGVSGVGGFGPDLAIAGMAPAGITANGGGNSGAAGGDRLVVHAITETALNNGGTAPIFSGPFAALGNGVIQPAAAVNNAFDDVTITDALISIVNTVVGLLLPVNVSTASFVQNGLPLVNQQAALLVNGGDEAGLRTTGLLAGIAADNFVVAASNNFNIKVNGNLPDPATFGADGLPVGDRLVLTGPGSLNIFSDKASPPNVSMQFSGALFNVQFSSIERVEAAPGNGTVNLIGDNNNASAANNQTDNFVVRGRDTDFAGGGDVDGANEFTVQINGSAPLLISAVQFLKAYGDDLQGTFNPTSLNTNDSSVDTLDIRAYADNTPRGWGIDVFFNEGAPAQSDGAQADLIIYHTATGISAPPDVFGAGTISENIVVQPSGPDNGEIRSTNATGGSLVYVLSYVNNTAMIFVDDDGVPGNGGFGNPALSDSDTLTLNGTNPDNGTPGTSGNDTFDIDLTRAGGVGTEWINVTSGASTLYQVRSFTNFRSLNINGLGGGDTTSIIGRNDASVSFNVNSGDDVRDAVTLPGTANASDFYQIGYANDGSVTALVTRSGAANFTRINMVGTGRVNVSAGGGTGSDFVQVFGTTGTDNFVVEPNSATAGNISLANSPLIVYSGLGTSGSGFNLNGDAFVNGAGQQDTVSIRGRAGAETYAFTPSSSSNTNSTVNYTTAALTTTFGLSAISGVTLSGNDNTDILTVNGSATNDTFVIAPSLGSGTYRSSSSPAVNFDTFENFTVNGGTGGFDSVEIDGTNAADTVTSTATVVTLVNPVTLGAGLDRLDINTLGGNDSIVLSLAVTGLAKFIDAGAGNDTVNLSAVAVDPADPTILGGDGDDLLIGSPNADLIFGGRGNDIIIGGAGVDVEYGEEGDDLFGDQLLGAGGISNLTADDAGNDQLFGGAGSDRFVWDGGDGSDTIEGGAGESDQVLFFGTAAAETFGFTQVGTRLSFTRSVGNIVLDIAGVDQFNLQTGGGIDVVNVNDIFQTDIRSIDVNFRNADGTADNAKDTINIQGREVADNVNITSPGAGTVNVIGLKYDIAIRNATPGDNDEFNFNANGGNDTVITDDSLATFFTATNDPLVAGGTNFFTINGGAGDDTLTGYGRLNGGAGNDTLTGSSVAQVIYGGDGDDALLGLGGDDVLIGGLGNDTFIGGTGNDTINGGDTTVPFGGAGLVDDGYDTILLNGTAFNDTITAFQSADVTLTYTVAPPVGPATNETDTLVTFGGVRTVEELKINAGAGDDNIFVSAADVLGTDGAVNSLLMNVDGGTHHTRDRLSVQDNGTGDLVLYRKSESDSAGTVSVGPGNAESLENVFTNVEFMQPVTTGRVLVFKHDPLEWNDDRFNASYLGSGATLNVDPNIDPGPLTPGPGGVFQPLPGDVDFYRVVAEKTGTLDIQVYFTEIPAVGARPGLPGNGNLDIQVQDANGNIIANGFGGNDGTGNNPELDTAPLANERVRIPAVVGQTYYLRVASAAGGGAVGINTYNITVVNTAAPVPTDIELLDNPVNTNLNSVTGAPGATAAGLSSDTGRSQFDNTTYDNDPTILIRVPDVVQIAGLTFLDDGPVNGSAPGNPPDEIIRIPFVTDLTLNAASAGFRVAVFITENNTGDVVLAGYAQPIAGRPGVFTFTFANDALVPDGSYFISSRVEMIDPTSGVADTGLNQGFGALASSLEIVVDTTIPTVAFGLPDLVNPNDGLLPSSDSGVASMPGTFSDRITSDLTPTFWGIAEANSIVRGYIDVNQNNAVDLGDIYIGTAVTIPLDGTNQSPTGQWELTSVVNMNDQNVRNLGGVVSPLPLGGLRHIIVTAEDLAGNITPAAQTFLNIFIDDIGPQVTRVDVNSQNNAYNIWDHKNVVTAPDTFGTLVPTPLVNSLVISFQDLPNRDVLFLYDALKQGVSEAPGLFVLKGDASGIIPIQRIILNNAAPVAGAPALATITLVFANPLPDDRFTLTISDEVQDPAGNHLDGESNAAEPHEPSPLFPSGNGLSGGNFIARFTVDSRPEVGTWGAGSAWIDTNGNNTFDPRNLDFTNRDITYLMGLTTDNLFAGNFAPTRGSVADGFDKLAAYGRVNGQWRWLVDTNNDGVADINVVDPAGINGIPVAGDFDGIASNGDEVGIFTGTTWYFDTNHDFKLDLGSAVNSTTPGYPVVGNFDGVGGDDLGVYRDNTFSIDLGRNGTIDKTFRVSLPNANNRPVAADMDGDKIDDIGLWVPNRAGVTPNGGSEWYIFVSGGTSVLNRIHPDPIDGVPVIDYKPVPFGTDMYIQYGYEFGQPILGNFDPPTTITSTALTTSSLFNSRMSLDVNNDGTITALDALIVINALNSNQGNYSVPNAVFSNGPFTDVTNDKFISPLDALSVINWLNANPGKVTPSGESGSANTSTAASDSIFSDLGAISGSDVSTDDSLLGLLALDQDLAAKKKK